MHVIYIYIYICIYYGEAVQICAIQVELDKLIKIAIIDGTRLL